MQPVFVDPFSPTFDKLRSLNFYLWEFFFDWNLEVAKDFEGIFKVRVPKGEKVQKVSALIQQGTSCLSQGIPLQRLRIWRYKRPSLKVDLKLSYGFGMTQIGYVFGQIKRTLLHWKVVGRIALFFLHLICLLVSPFPIGRLFGPFPLLNMIVLRSFICGKPLDCNWFYEWINWLSFDVTLLTA